MTLRIKIGGKSPKIKLGGRSLKIKVNANTPQIKFRKHLKFFLNPRQNIKNIS